MRSNKINNVDLFTSSANEKFSKHIKTQSKQALDIINNKINWTKLLRPIEKQFQRQNRIIHQQAEGHSIYW
jgi:hypothetical protein